MLISEKYKKIKNKIEKIISFKFNNATGIFNFYTSVLKQFMFISYNKIHK